MIAPVRNLLLVTELTDNEKRDLGFPAGVGEALDVGVVMATGPEVSIEVGTGDRVFFLCSAPKCGAELRLIHSDCVLAVDKNA